MYIVTYSGNTWIIHKKPQKVKGILHIMSLHSKKWGHVPAAPHV